jgi:hypothetical protein
MQGKTGDERLEAVLPRQIDDLEPKLMRHGYKVRILASQFQRQTGGNPAIPAGPSRRRPRPGAHGSDAAR